MTSDGAEVVGSGDDGRPRRPLPLLLLAALVIAGVTVVATRARPHHPATGSPAPSPPPTSAAPSLAIVSEADFAALEPKVVDVGGLAIAISHTSSSPPQGTLTTLDGPPGTSPLTFTIDELPVGVAGDGHTAWIAERTIAPIDGDGAGTLEARDLRTGRRLARLALPQAPNSIAIAAGSVWVGLDGSIVEVDIATRSEQVHATPTGDVLGLVADATGTHLYAAIAHGSEPRILRWTVPSLTVAGEHRVPAGLQPTTIALEPGSLWVGEADPTATTARLERLDAVTLAGAPLRAVADTTFSERAVYSGTHELWLFTPPASLRCVRLTPAGPSTLGAATTIPDLGSRDDLTGLVAAVGDRVYVASPHGALTYFRSALCPG